MGAVKVNMDSEFLLYMNSISIFEVMDICERNNAHVVCEDGRIVMYALNA